jgi:hypothetical protein
MPKAKKAAHRSSTILKHLKNGYLVNPKVKGAFLEPGEITIFLIPRDLKCKTNVCAEGISEYIMEYKNTPENGIALNYAMPNYRILSMVLLLFWVSIHSRSGSEACVMPPPTKIEAVLP